MTFIYASPLRVGVEWARTTPGIPAVGEELPTDNTTWAASGFVTAAGAGGSSNINYRFGHHVITFQTWACTPDSPYPPHWKAENLCEVFRQETLRHVGRFLTLPNCSENAKVLQSQVVLEPRKTFGDFGNYASFTMGVQLHWIASPK